MWVTPQYTETLGEKLGINDLSDLKKFLYEGPKIKSKDNFLGRTLSVKLSRKEMYGGEVITKLEKIKFNPNELRDLTTNLIERTNREGKNTQEVNRQLKRLLPISKKLKEIDSKPVGLFQRILSTLRRVFGNKISREDFYKQIEQEGIKAKKKYKQEEYRKQLMPQDFKEIGDELESLLKELNKFQPEKPHKELQRELKALQNDLETIEPELKTKGVRARASEDSLTKEELKKAKQELILLELKQLDRELRKVIVDLKKVEGERDSAQLRKEVDEAIADLDSLEKRISEKKTPQKPPEVKQGVARRLFGGKRGASYTGSPGMRQVTGTARKK
jgi:hypothetical protein